MNYNLNTSQILLVFASFIISFSSCEPLNGDIVKTDQEHYSPSEQKIIGNNLSQEIIQTQSLPILDPFLYKSAYQYANIILKHAIKSGIVTREKAFNWNIKIIENDNTKSAFTLPGGHIFITTGMFKYLIAENEFFALICHEISYAEKDLAIDKLVQEWGGMTIGDVLLGNELSELDQIALYLSKANYSEDEVIRADNFAINIYCPFQYDAFAMENIFSRYSIDQNKEMVEWLNLKPVYQSRIDNMREQVKNCGTGSSNEEKYSKFIQLLPN